MNNKATRSNTDFTLMVVNESGLTIKKEKPKDDLVIDDQDNEINLEETTVDTNKINLVGNGKLNELAGHDLNDQQRDYIDKQTSTTVEAQLTSIKKFNGQGDVEQWLTEVLDKLDSFQLSSNERHKLIPDILTGEALIWYFKQQHHMSTFNSFIQNLLHQYENKVYRPAQLPSFGLSSKQLEQETMRDVKESIVEPLRNQMLINSLEKLQKFSGKSKQNVSKWLRETQQTMHTLQLTDEKKLFLISTCLEADARDWFFDNMHLFKTWTSFTQKLLNTFESSGKADISFHRLRHYQQGLTQDVRQYYFEIMKLCKEANALMDDASKLQYLKDGLKPSLRFDVLLKNPQTTEEFLEYAQKVEELKSLDEKDSIIDQAVNHKSPDSLTSKSKTMNINSSQVHQPIPSQHLNFNNSYNKTQFSNNSNSDQEPTTAPTRNDYYTTVPKPPYQCYKCGSGDHYIRNCPIFSREGPLNDGNVSSIFSNNPSPIFIFSNVNQVSMKIMFDSGATTSFISKAALKRTKHLPINTNPQRYLMADGYTSFEAIGFVKIFIEFGGIKTSILVGVVSSLCTDCILGMDYINKYKVNLNSKR